MTSSPSNRVYPVSLQLQVSHAARFARALRTLEVPIALDLAVTARDEEDDERADDGAWLWLEGRAEEVEVFAAEVTRAWSAGELDVNAAVRSIRDYLQALQVALEERYAPSPSGAPASGVLKVEPAIRRFDPLRETLADVPAVVATR
jgi:hypothetical protein